MTLRWHGPAWGAFAIAASCAPIEDRALSPAPINTCPEHPCEAYRPGRTRAECSSQNRCEFQGLPDYSFSVVVSVPTASLFAPGHTFVVTRDDLFPTRPVANARCAPPLCTALPRLGQASGGYLVTNGASAALGFPLADGASIPVRVEFIPLSGSDDARTSGLPLDVTWGASRRIVDLSKELEDPTRESLAYVEPLVSGSYRRVSFPEAPYDSYFPPVEAVVKVGTTFTDSFTLQLAALDDPTGEARTARVRRADGLDGWRTWIADARTRRRISTLRTLTGTEAELRLDTSGHSQPASTALRDGVVVIVAPPDSWIAVPRLESLLVGGQGLRNLSYPTLPPLARVTGLVAVPADGGLLAAVPANVALTSVGIQTADGVETPLLRYSTTVATDGSGRFATVVPPGTYDVTVDPSPVTGFGQLKTTSVIRDGAVLTLGPPLRTPVTGRVVLADGRPLAGAEVIATPTTAAQGTDPLPRVARTRVNGDGGFRLDLDRGDYTFTVAPEAGTGFPRVVLARSVGDLAVDLETIEVTAPMKLPLRLKDPRINDLESPVDRPIAGAVVRVFAVRGGGLPMAEVGRAITATDGTCEILLPRSLSER